MAGYSVVITVMVAIMQFVLITRGLRDLSDKELGKLAAAMVIVNPLFMIPNVFTIVRWLSA